jgi:hypothetical protein
MNAASIDVFDHVSSSGFDLRGDFDSIWHELDRRDKTEEADASSSATVWLECDGEFADLATVKCTGLQDTVLGIEVVEFECPHCRKPHESLLFR